MLEYREKIRALRVRTLDFSIKTVPVDDSNTVAELTKTVCTRIGKLHIGTVCISSVSVVYPCSILPCVVAFHVLLPFVLVPRPSKP